MAAMSLAIAQAQSNTTNTTSGTNRRMDEPFPLKLHRLLEDVENSPQSDILSWDPDGRSFTIFQPKAFAESIMGQYFRQTKYKSFQRQMNLYGFTREVRGKIRGVYSHPRFMRQDRDLCLSIKRVSKAPSSPRFYPSPSPATMKSGVANTATSAMSGSSHHRPAASIDVSSPLFAPLGHPTMNPITLGLGITSAAAKTMNAVNKNNKTLSSFSNNNNSNNFAPSFTFPIGGLASFAATSRQVSLEDEESMGTIDEMPTMMMMGSGSTSFQPQQPRHHHMFGSNEKETTAEEFAVAAV